MANSLYTLALDFSKELNYTKAIMARQGDKGITISVDAYLHGLPLVPDEQGIFTMKATTPKGKYVDAPTVSVVGNKLLFSLGGEFLSEKGYYERCYVEYRTPTEVFTTQDIILFNTGVSDISQGQAQAYVSQLEQLIEKYNNTFDAFMTEITDTAGNIQTQLDQMTTNATELTKQLNDIQTQITALDLDQWLQEAKTYADTGDNTTLTAANEHADSGDATTLESAKTYSDGKLEEGKVYTQEQVTNLLALLNKKEEYVLPSTLISSGSIKCTSRGGITTITGTGKLAHNVNFGDVLVEALPVSMTNTTGVSAIGTGTLTGDKMGQIYVEGNSSRLKANTNMRSGEWLTVGFSYPSPIPTLGVLSNE